MPLQIRRGTNAERLILASPLVSGELLWIVDDQRLYIGDGTTLARDLAPVTGYNDDDSKDAAASIFTSGTHSGISFTYDGSTSIDATVSLPALLENLSTNGFDITGDGNINITGSVTATSFTGDYKGSISADDSTILVDALNGSINLSGTVKGDIIPDQNEAYDLGSSSNRFKDLYLSGTSLYLGSAQITASGAAVDLPAGSTINGVLISDIESGVAAGSDYNINIVGDDSSSIINSSSRTVTASGGFFGNLTGNVTGDTTGYHTGDVTGSIFGDDSTLIIDAVDNKITVEEVSVNTVLNVDNIIGDDIDGVNISANGTVPLTINGIGTLGIASGQVYFTINAAKGTLAVPTTSAAGDVLGGIAIQGYDGSGYKAAGLIAAGWDATATLSDQNPRSLLSLVSYGGGTTIRIATFDYLGVWSAPLQKTTVYSNAGTAIPAAATVGAGARAFVSDATTNTFGTAYTGGGANSVPVYSDGTSWYIG